MFRIKTQAQSFCIISAFFYVYNLVQQTPIIIVMFSWFQCNLTRLCEPVPPAQHERMNATKICRIIVVSLLHMLKCVYNVSSPRKEDLETDNFSDLLHKSADILLEELI